MDQVRIYTNVLSVTDIGYLASEVPVYTIEATSGTGGTINPSGSVAVNSGSNKNFSIAPLTGYVITNVTVDGVLKGAISNFTFTNVTANHSISAGFAIPPKVGIVRNGSGGMEITWPTTYPGTLLSTPKLGAGAVWTPVTNLPTPVNGYYKVTLTPGTNNAFYGLGQ